MNTTLFQVEASPMEGVMLVLEGIILIRQSPLGKYLVLCILHKMIVHNDVYFSSFIIMYYILVAFFLLRIK